MMASSRFFGSGAVLNDCSVGEIRLFEIYDGRGDVRPWFEVENLTNAPEH